MKKRTETKKLALSAILCALSAVVTMLGCIFDLLDLTACTIACASVAFARIELKGKYPYLIYAVTSALLLIIFPGASATIYFVVFFGYYPIVKGFLEKLPKVPMYILKYLVFNIAAIVIFFFAKALFIAPDAVIDKTLIIALWVLVNIFFGVFDMCMTVLITAYVRYYREKWGIGKLLDKDYR